MKKRLALLLICMMVGSSCAVSFADTAAVSIPTDVKGTPYETAVAALMNKSVINGYEDGTFKPNAEITRAEACIVIVKGLATTDGALSSANESSFTDLAGYSWAKSYINFAADKGIVDGYMDHSFKPGAKITYNEMAAMLVKALGYQQNDLTGVWPDNYMQKATELGMLKQITAGEGFAGTKEATRGDVALMTYSVLEKLQKMAVPTNSQVQNTSSTAIAQPQESRAGKLKDFSGNATGMLLGYAKAVNADKEKVYELEFLMGKDVIYVNTDASCKVPEPIAFDGSICTIKMANGVVNDISITGGKLKNYQPLTMGWTEVTDRNSRFITMNTKEMTVMKDAVFYKATFSGDSINGYKEASLSDISQGCKIKAYDVTDDSTSNADIVIIVEKSDASKI